MDVVGAIADPVRREILSLLTTGSRTAGGLAAEFDISRPAVSRHLRVLRQHRLVHDAIRGRERHYRLDVTALAPLAAWLADLAAAGDSGEVERARHARGDSRDPRDPRDTGDSGDVAHAGDVRDTGRPARLPSPFGADLDALATEVHRARRDRRRGSAARPQPAAPSEPDAPRRYARAPGSPAPAPADVPPGPPPGSRDPKDPTDPEERTA